jgi:hypothetical protein
VRAKLGLGLGTKCLGLGLKLTGLLKVLLRLFELLYHLHEVREIARVYHLWPARWEPDGVRLRELLVFDHRFDGVVNPVVASH